MPPALRALVVLAFCALAPPASAGTASQRYMTGLTPGRLTGQCTVNGSIGSPLPEACDGVTLVFVDDESGTEAGSSSTDAHGRFTFHTEPGKKYRIRAAGPYTVALPSVAVAGGRVISVRLEPGSSGP